MAAWNTGPEAERISAYLRTHPGFLADHPDLYAVLEPPRRVHGKVLADHMDAMLRAARAHAAEMDAKANAVLAAGGLPPGCTDAYVANTSFAGYQGRPPNQSWKEVWTLNLCGVSKRVVMHFVPAGQAITVTANPG